MKTPLTREAYAALSSAVGPENISEDDSVVAGYAWNGIGANPGPNRLSSVWASAVVLPGSTEEVQAVVKICGRYNVRFRAMSTGVLANNTNPGHFIVLDLKRMNGIQIDARNQMAVIEPAATAGQLQAEAMKHGLTCHIVGAGPPHSPLASATAMQGIGISGATTGVNWRNLLSFEWVTPTGEIKRIGTAGSGSGWFSGEGPGPGFRGMIRGDIGTMGGLGVFTKIGFKLHPWKGQAVPERTGVFPQLGMKVPEHAKVYHLSWQSWEAAAQAAMSFNASRVADFWVRIPPTSLGIILTAVNSEYIERLKAQTLPEPAKDENTKSWTVLTTACSEAEARYKEKVMAKIIADTGAKVVPLAPNEAEIFTRNLVTSCYILRVYRPAIGSVTSMGVLDSFRQLPKAMDLAEKLLEPDAKRGHYVSANAVWAWPTESRFLWAENAPMYSVTDKAASAAATRYFLRVGERMADEPIGINGFAAGPAAELFGPKLGQANEWMRKVKNAFDPNNLSIEQHYIAPTRSPAGRLWPIGKRVLLSKLGERLFRLMTEQMMRKGPN